MAGRLTDQQISDVYKLYRQGHYIRFISEETGVSRTSIWGLTKLRKKINPVTGKRFRTLREYHNYLSSSSYRDKSVMIYRKENACYFLARVMRGRLEEMEESQEWLASKIGVSRQSVSRYFSGESLPPKDKIDRICEVLGIDERSLPNLL